MTSMPFEIRISSTDLERIESTLAEMAETNSPTIAGLRNELQRATVVQPKEMPPDVVSMNSIVRFSIQPSGKQFKLRLVYPQDARDHLSNIISVTSPIGAALLGLAVGQTIEWPLPGGHTSQVKVIEVADQPEREGRYYL